MQTILITGINGFLGSSLAKALSSDFSIIGLEYSLENLFRIVDCNYKVYATKDGIADAIFTDQQIKIIIHTATFYGKNNEDFTQMFDANLYSPFNLLNKAIQYKCELFVNTDTVLDRFVNTYALTKRHFQEWLYLRKNEIKVINMQLEHFYGPGAPDTNFITSMINRLRQNEPVIDLTKGEQLRDFVYLDDVISAYKIVIGKVLAIPDPYTEFQVTTNQLISIKDILLLLKKLTKSKSKLNFGSISYRENELLESKTDNKSLRMLGWMPITELNRGLDDTIFSEIKN
ncbi:MAG: NAD-dependent epimerase/dehydratase family protein [Bacteroidales bacterium]|nr:NAD-dependent epimerase/dehydratase family protein [Bacteroidales bacterium]